MNIKALLLSIALAKAAYCQGGEATIPLESQKQSQGSPLPKTQKPSQDSGTSFYFPPTIPTLKDSAGVDFYFRWMDSLDLTRPFVDQNSQFPSSISLSSPISEPKVNGQVLRFDSILPPHMFDDAKNFMKAKSSYWPGDYADFHNRMSQANEAISQCVRIFRVDSSEAIKQFIEGFNAQVYAQIRAIEQYVPSRQFYEFIPLADALQRETESTEVLPSIRAAVSEAYQDVLEKKLALENQILRNSSRYRDAAKSKDYQQLHREVTGFCDDLDLLKFSSSSIFGVQVHSAIPAETYESCIEAYSGKKRLEARIRGVNGLEQAMLLQEYGNRLQRNAALPPRIGVEESNLEKGARILGHKLLSDKTGIPEYFFSVAELMAPIQEDCVMLFGSSGQDSIYMKRQADKLYEEILIREIPNPEKTIGQDAANPYSAN